MFYPRRSEPRSGWLIAIITCAVTGAISATAQTAQRTPPDLDPEWLAATIQIPVLPAGRRAPDSVELEVHVDTAGRLLASGAHTGIAKLDAAIASALRDYRVRPATAFGRPEEAWRHIVLMFAPVNRSSKRRVMVTQVDVRRLVVEEPARYDSVDLQRSLKWRGRPKENAEAVRVVVLADVNRFGRVERVFIVETGDSLFNDNAEAAVMGTPFTPAIQDGRPVRSWARMPLLFLPPRFVDPDRPETPSR